MGEALPCPLPSSCFCCGLCNWVSDAIRRRMLSTWALYMMSDDYCNGLDGTEPWISTPWIALWPWVYYFPSPGTRCKSGEGQLLPLSPLDWKVLCNCRENKHQSLRPMATEVRLRIPENGQWAWLKTKKCLACFLNLPLCFTVWEAMYLKRKSEFNLDFHAVM